MVCCCYLCTIVHIMGVCSALLCTITQTQITPYVYCVHICAHNAHNCTYLRAICALIYRRIGLVFCACVRSRGTAKILMRFFWAYFRVFSCFLTLFKPFRTPPRQLPALAQHPICKEFNNSFYTPKYNQNTSLPTTFIKPKRKWIETSKTVERVVLQNIL